MDAADRLVFVDLETTAPVPAMTDTEVGIVRLEGHQVVDEWSSLINPGCEIPGPIQAFTGISDEMVAGAPRFSAGRRVGAREAARGGVRRTQCAFRLLVPARRVSRARGSIFRPTFVHVKLLPRLFPNTLATIWTRMMERHLPDL